MLSCRCSRQRYPKLVYEVCQSVHAYIHNIYSYMHTYIHTYIHSYILSCRGAGLSVRSTLVGVDISFTIAEHIALHVFSQVDTVDSTISVIWHTVKGQSALQGREAERTEQLVCVYVCMYVCMSIGTYFFDTYIHTYIHT